MEYKVYGCKVNKYYLNKWIHYLQTTDAFPQEDLYLIATCVVTDRAKAKWIHEVLEQAKAGKKVLIIGCGSIHQGKPMSDKIFYDYYPELKPYAERIALLQEDPLSSEGLGGFGIMSPEQLLWTKSFVIIQNGCDNHCSFCLTVSKRGRHRNRDLEEILSEIRQIQTNGGQEIVLTGINLAARGAQSSLHAEQSQLPKLLQAILRETAIPRIRISSLDPQYLTDEFFETVQDPRFLPHFHLSIQSFSDNILHRMNRGYSKQQLETVLQKFRSLQRPDLDYLSLGADLITGFPGETEEDFAEILQGVQDYQINKLHAFPFSDHHRGEKIPASKFPDQIDFAERKERNRRLIALGDEIKAKFIQKNNGRTASVLIESSQKGMARGWTDNYLQVRFPSALPVGSLEMVKLKSEFFSS